MNLVVHELRAGSGRPLVLLHGWMGAAADFEPLAKDDAFAGRTLIGVDLPGHGETPDYDREYDFADVAGWLDASLPAGDFDLVGYSMGGRLALYYAATHRQRLHSLTLIGAHPGIEHPIEQRRRLELDTERATWLVAESTIFLEEWGNLSLFGAAAGPAWDAVRARRERELETHAYAWARALLCLSVGRQIPLWTLSTSLSLPTLFIAGEGDEKYRQVASEFEAQNSGYVTSRVVPNASHAAHLDDPTAVAELVANRGDAS